MGFGYQARGYLGLVKHFVCIYHLQQETEIAGDKSLFIFTTDVKANTYHMLGLSDKSMNHNIFTVILTCFHFSSFPIFSLWNAFPSSSSPSSFTSRPGHSSSSRWCAEYTARIRGINGRPGVPELGHRRRSLSFSGWSLCCSVLITPPCACFSASFCFSLV